MPYIFLSAILVLMDQLVKLWSVRNLIGRGAVPLIPGFLQLFYTENTGAAFGILKNHRWVFLVTSVLASVFILWLLLTKKFTSTPINICLALVLGGAVGNLVDRFLRGYVVDMFEFTFFRFAIFNLADVFLSIGGLLFCIFFIGYEWKGKKDLRP